MQASYKCYFNFNSLDLEIKFFEEKISKSNYKNSLAVIQMLANMFKYLISLPQVVIIDYHYRHPIH